MATTAPITGAPTRAPAFRPLPSHRRKVIAAEIATHLARVDVLIARLDRADAPFEDLEVTGAEDDFMHHGWNGPGCPIADPGGCEHNGREIEGGY